jgi:hypothetical protein
VTSTTRSPTSKRPLEPQRHGGRGLLPSRRRVQVRRAPCSSARVGAGRIAAPRRSGRESGCSGSTSSGRGIARALAASGRRLAGVDALLDQTPPAAGRPARRPDRRGTGAARHSPSRAFLHLGRRRASACGRCGAARALLRPGGRLVFDVFRPSRRTSSSYPRPMCWRSGSARHAGSGAVWGRARSRRLRAVVQGRDERRDDGAGPWVERTTGRASSPRPALPRAAALTDGSNRGPTVVARTTVLGGGARTDRLGILRREVSVRRRWCSERDFSVDPRGRRRRPLSWERCSTFGVGVYPHPRLFFLTEGRRGR